jgi:MoxR-like ATPase
MMAYQFKRIFKRPAPKAPRRDDDSRRDRRDGAIYVWNDDLELAVNVALATERPLLVRGPSGVGKSSLAASIAVTQGWRYYEEVISSATEARHLLWRIDVLKRLSDAQAREAKPPIHYIEPGVLWWAFASESAMRRGATEGNVDLLRDPSRFPGKADQRAVVLLDEIDKADPEVPNNLLVPLGSLEFTVTDASNLTVKALTPPLVVVTTNDERELPNAFTRRCVVVKLDHPDRPLLLKIAEAHFGADDGLYGRVADAMASIAAAKQTVGAARPSTAEYLDAIATCRDLKIDPTEHTTWKAVERAVFLKPTAHD